MPEAAERPDPSRSRLGKYHLIALLARGGMGNVYLASAQGNQGFSKLLVVKELKPEFVDDEMFLKMFHDEARLSARLAHPNIVQTFEVGEDQHYLVMEYLEGQPLTSLVKRLQQKGKKLEVRQLLTILVAVLEALEYAHGLKDFDGTRLNIVHRDVCPHNIYVTYDGRTKLLDFGIAKALQTETTRVGTYKGRIAYMPPEQLAGNVDARADVYAAGVVLWEGLAGRRMWQGKNETDITVGLTLGKVPSFREAAPDVDERLASLVAKATAADRDDRLASCTEFREQVEAYLATIGGPLSARELGRAVNDLFSEEAAKLHAVVEEHVTRLRAALATGRSSPEILSLRRDSMSSGPTPAFDGTALLPLLSESPPPKAIASTVPPPGRRRRRRTALLVTTVFVGVAAVAGVVVGMRMVGKSETNLDTTSLAAAAAPATPESTAPVSPPPPPKPSAAAADSAPGASAVTPTVAVTVKVNPKGAKVLLDEAALDGDPPVAHVAKNAARHTLRVEAPGYVSDKREIGATADQTVEVTLAQEPVARTTTPRYGRPPPTQPATAVATSTPPTAAPATTTAAAATGTGDAKGPRPKREIDRKDPYSK